MAFLETKHTLSRINKIRKDLIKFVIIISCISMFTFIGYYSYLVYLNRNEPFYIGIYSLLISFIIIIFCVELSLRENKKSLRNEKRLVIEKKRTIKQCIKIFKFSLKAILVGIAIYETFTNFNLGLSNIINIFSAIVLIVQIIIELITKYIISQIDYFKLSLDLDISESGTIINGLVDKFFPIKDLQEKIAENKGENYYTDKEQKMIRNIRKEATEYSKEQEMRKNELEQMLPTKNKGFKIPNIKEFFTRKK